MNKCVRHIFIILTCTLVAQLAYAEDGYDMWLRYPPLVDQALSKQYQQQLNAIIVDGDSNTLQLARDELVRGITGLTGKKPKLNSHIKGHGNLIIANHERAQALGFSEALANLGEEGFLLKSMRIKGKKSIVLTANSDLGKLYGAFHLLRLLQTNSEISALDISSTPQVQHRVVNHWDNLNRVVERGYAGLSLWEWGSLPEYKNPRYIDYARINASLGINGTVINNVNADPRILSDQFLEKAAVLAAIFRPYGIKLYLSINFDSPRAFGEVDSADPLDPRVATWWQQRVKKVYQYIPDFGGFLVKADSEGQPGPQGYGRNHAEGANMLADALAPYGGIVFWRAFVYNPDIKDRFRGAYDEFMPLDGKFRDNVILQIKNGPIDFQPREPLSPLFGGLKKTNLAVEFQVTQEYFGFDKHLAYQGPLFTEALSTDTYAKGQGTTLGKLLGDKNYRYGTTGMAAVINPGTDRNWTGHPFVQSSWYAFGRLAWDYQLSAEHIANEWAAMTFSSDPRSQTSLVDIMMISREAGVNYRSPLGLTHLFAQGHHYGPAPWYEKAERADWTAAYYHRASNTGLGFDRTETGSNAIAQYSPALSAIYGDPSKVPEELLLWFHHLSWDHQLASGKTLWQALVAHYYLGVEQVKEMSHRWESLEGHIDQPRYEQVKALLAIQLRDAIRWRDACVLYFQTYSGKEIPNNYEKPQKSLEEYQALERTHYVPEPWHPASSSRALK